MKVKRVLIIIVSLVFIIAIGFTFKGKKASAANYVDDYVIDNVQVGNVTTESAHLYWTDSSYRSYFILKYSGYGREYKKIAETTREDYYINNLKPGQYIDEYVVIGCDDNIYDKTWFYLSDKSKTVEILTKPMKVEKLYCTKQYIIDGDLYNSYIELDWDTSRGADEYEIYVNDTYFTTSFLSHICIYFNNLVNFSKNEYYYFKVVPIAKKVIW